MHLVNFQETYITFSLPLDEDDDETSVSSRGIDIYFI